MPRVYGFDTGLVSFARGWDPLRAEDYGVLWEHLVLEHLQAHEPDARLHHWRDKSGREVDFVIVRTRDEVDAIECKWNPEDLDARGLEAFRKHHPKGRNYLVCPLGVRPYDARFGSLKVRVCAPAGIGGK
jgi:predicted AAA+ superfamily ATPase